MAKKKGRNVYNIDEVNFEIDYDKLAETIVTANEKHSQKYSISREWMKFIIYPVFWVVGILSGVLAVSFFVYGAIELTAELSSIQNIDWQQLNLKAQIVYKLQDLEYQTPELIEFRKTLLEAMVRKVRELNKENFAVRQHLKYVELYANPDNYTTLTYENILQMREELAPLIIPDEDDAKAVRFDALMYGIELAYLIGKKYTRARTDLIKKCRGSQVLPIFPKSWLRVNLSTKFCTQTTLMVPESMNLSISGRICGI